MPSIHRALSRREALKILAALSGAVNLSSLPNQWETPLVEVGALPAHAQVSSSPPKILEIAKINEDYGWVGPSRETGGGSYFLWSALISHNVPAGIAVDEDGNVDMEIRFTFSGGDGEALSGFAAIWMGNEYLGTTLGYFKLFLDRNRLPLVVKVKLWLVDQDGRPTNRLTYEFDPASAPRLEGGQKTPVLDDLLKEHNAKVAVAH